MKVAQSGQREQQEQRHERGRTVRSVVGRSGLGDGEGSGGGWAGNENRA